MSETPQKPTWQTIVVSLVLTGALAAIAYYVWIYANSSVRMLDLTKGTLLTDMRFFVGLLAVFLVLTFLDRIIGFILSKFGNGH
ncbi:hypothetical protein FIV00_07080 [Labrenzia sp. THAF82]|uniref:hypothetical protein n=1 Tax=Labrenzia sp. THAF82 TaxID=2587861 RepID=UPI001268BB21|nr:hypothetical protein [Labrenzia sp. THAF82]QFT30228.1 hypothetical protein FIV00_07080 [Labrenzia sp. THAF82]